MPNSPPTGGRTTSNGVAHVSPESVPRLLLSPRETALALGISERTLWGATASGDIPCVRIGRLVRYAVADLEKWLDKKKEGSRT